MDFDFVKNKPEQKMKTKKEIATSGNPQGITPAIKAAARKLAESSKGLNIAEFQRKYNIHVLDIESLLGD